jgi:hypothetical protein
VIISQTPRDLNTSALHRALNPNDADWGLSDLLLAEVADSLRVANWQRGGGKKRDYPKPIPRPGVEPDTKVIGKGAIPLDQMDEFLGWK